MVGLIFVKLQLIINIFFFFLTKKAIRFNLIAYL